MRQDSPNHVIPTLVSLVILCIGCSAQSIPDEYRYLPHRWDGTHHVAFFGRGLLRRGESRPIRGFVDGSQRGSPIDVFEDFPQAKEVVVEDVAAGVSGRTVVAAVLITGPKLGRHVILTYDETGKLESILDTEPYYAQAIATDENGNIFTLANRLDEGKGVSQPYPLLIVYDAQGNILREALSSGIFRNGSQAINPGEDNADTSLMVSEGRLFIYAARENEIVITLLDGTVIRRLRLDGVLAGVEKAERMQHVRLEQVAFLDENNAVLDVIGHSAWDGRTMDTTKMHPAIHIVDLNTGASRVALRGEMPGWNFLGAKDNTLLILSGVGEQSSTVSHDIPQR